VPPLTSCSVPVWISVLSPIVQPASMQPPPMPIQSDENSSPDACWVAVGTVQSPEIELNCLPPCSSVPGRSRTSSYSDSRRGTRAGWI
jgi:hypothetical protein